MQQLIEFDKQLFLDINKLHTPLLDPVMLFLSSYEAWGIIAILILLYVFYSKDKAWRWPVLCFMFLSVASTNALNQLVKITIARPRPIHEAIFTDLIHSLEKYDASYSFFSAHSSSSFALAVFALLVVRKKFFTVIVLSWALLVGYSRIYVGKHYPIDVVVGILFGVLMAVVWWKIYMYYKKRKTEIK